MIKEIPFAELQPGQKLQQTIYDREGRLLLREGTVLTSRHLQRMQDWGLDQVQVEGVWPNQPVDSDSGHVLDQELQGELLKAIETAFASAAEEKGLDLDRLASLTPILVREMAAHDQVTLNLAGLRRVDNYTFMHSLSVAVLSVAAGMELGLSEDQLLELSFAGALHDIGKMRIPLAVLNKPGKLDAEEWQLMKRHPRLGMELLTNHGGVATAALQGIYEHHERMDGSGYPHRLPGKQISLFGRIVAVADVYDAMTSDRVYRAGMAPHLAVEQLIGESLTRFDWPIVSAFIRSLVVYPVGSLVVMDNGEVGRVISYRRTVPYRPKVAIIADAYGRRVFPPRECDMLKELTRFVTEVRKK